MTMYGGKGEAINGTGNPSPDYGTDPGPVYRPDLRRMPDAQAVPPAWQVPASPPETGSDVEGAHQFKDDPLHQAWSEFLSSQPWQWFVTFTFKEEIHPEAADKLYRVWINKLNRAIYGQRWRKKHPFGVKHVRALEWQKRGVLHYHALIANVGLEDRERWALVWQQLGEDSKAGFIKIDQYDDSKGGAEAYLSKYVTKGGQVDVSRNFLTLPHIPSRPTNADPDKQLFG